MSDQQESGSDGVRTMADRPAVPVFLIGTGILLMTFPGYVGLHPPYSVWWALVPTTLAAATVVSAVSLLWLAVDGETRSRTPVSVGLRLEGATLLLFGLSSLSRDLSGEFLPPGPGSWSWELSLSAVAAALFAVAGLFMLRSAKAQRPTAVHAEETPTHKRDRSGSTDSR